MCFRERRRIKKYSAREITRRDVGSEESWVRENGLHQILEKKANIVGSELLARHL